MIKQKGYLFVFVTITIVLILGLFFVPGLRDNILNNTASTTSSLSGIKGLGEIKVQNSPYVGLEGFETVDVLKVSGLGAETEVVEYIDGEDRVVKKRPGKTIYDNVIITRVYYKEKQEWFNWYNSVVDGRTERKSGSVTWNDKRGQIILKYTFYHSWPCKYEVIEEDGVLVERMELTIEGIDIVNE